MGLNQSFENIQKKYGSKGVDYVISKNQERKIYERINDEIVRLNDHADLQQRDDVEFLNQEKRRLNQALQDGKNEVEAKNRGAIQQAEAKHKMKVQQFSGYNQKRTWLQALQKQVKNKYHTERVRMEEKVRYEVSNHKKGGLQINRIPEYDNHPDNYRRSIENECIRKYPSNVRQVDATELQRKLTWENYKQNFVGILNRDQVRREIDTACSQVKNNITGGSGAICC